MSLASRQQTCAACGKRLHPGAATSLEPLIDDIVRYVVVHWQCSTSPRRAVSSARAENVSDVRRGGGNPSPASV